MEIRTIKPARDDKAFLGFYCDPQTKGKVAAVAAHYKVSMSQLLTAFAENAETLCWFVPLGEDRPAAKNETR